MIKLADILSMGYLRNLQLLTGNNGLDRRVKKVGILDQELIEGMEGVFSRGDFVITTFATIGYDIDGIYKAIEHLIEDEISALAIKKIYIQQLPDYLVQCANEKGIPLFLFDEDIAVEDIIQDIFLSLSLNEQLYIEEEKVSIMLSKEFQEAEMKSLAYNLNPFFNNWCIVSFFTPKNELQLGELITIVKKFKRLEGLLEHKVIKYGNGIIFIATHNEPDITFMKDIRVKLMTELNLNPKSFWIGHMEQLMHIDRLNKSILKAMMSAEVCIIREEQEINYSQVGKYKLFLSQSCEWLNEYVQDILAPIEAKKPEILETAKLFVKCQGDIKKVALKGFQHNNTIRYRLSKLRLIMDVDNDYQLYLKLANAFTCREILEIRMGTQKKTHPILETGRR